MDSVADDQQNARRFWRRPVVWSIVGVLFLMTVVGSVAYFSRGSEGSRGSDKTARESGGKPSSGASFQTRAKMSRIAGASVGAVSASLTAQWKGQFVATGDGGDLIMDLPRPAGGKMHIVVSPLNAGSDEVAWVQCMVMQPNLTVDHVVLDDVSTCLTPLMAGADKDAISTWLLDMSRMPVPAENIGSFDRFKVRVIHSSNNMFAVAAWGL